MKKLIVFVLVLSLSLFLVGCDSKNIVQKRESNNKDYIIVDVRTKEEYLASHIDGAINIPYDTIDENIDLDKKMIIKVYCQSGRRSKMAYTTLTKLGYKVIDLGAYDNIDLPKVGE